MHNASSPVFRERMNHSHSEKSAVHGDSHKKVQRFSTLFTITSQTSLSLRVPTIESIFMIGILQYF